ncbi:hypothetical protein CPC08DRAFT_759903 [Agrocybe pediades]|nr:hypothetical protein CPC08DRAFT_759903 [Agrocybe pediades]
MPRLACLAYPRLVSPPRLCSPTPPCLAHLVSPSPSLLVGLSFTLHRPARPHPLPSSSRPPSPLLLEPRHIVFLTLRSRSSHSLTSYRPLPPAFLLGSLSNVPPPPILDHAVWGPGAT